MKEAVNRRRPASNGSRPKRAAVAQDGKRPHAIYETPSRIRDPGRRDAVRAQIIESALNLISMKGFHNTSVEEIADAAGLTIGSLYKYVRSKHDILFLITNERSADMIENFRAAAATSTIPDDRLRAVIDQMCRDMDRFAKTLRVNYRESHHLDPQALNHLLGGVDNFRDALFTVIRTVGEKYGQTDESVLRMISDNLWTLTQMWAVQHRIYAKHTNLDRFIEIQTDLIFRQLGVPARTNSPGP